jgi:hypothetical protein
MLRFETSARRAALAVLAVVAACEFATSAHAISGASLALRSNGASQGGSWVLNDDGYVGTYVTLAAPGDVTIAVQASGTSFGGVAPHMNIAVADSVAGFDVAAGQRPISIPLRSPRGRTSSGRISTTIRKRRPARCPSPT